MYIKDFGTPTRITTFSTTKEFKHLVNKYNGITNVYSSVFWRTVENNNIVKYHINKAFFDFDNDNDSVIKFTNYLIKNDIKFEIFYSGRGHHIYTYCEGEGFSENLRILQLSLLTDAGVMCDPHVLGDVARIARVPNTWNFRSKSFCIPIYIDEIESDMGHVQRFETIKYGNKILNLENYTESNFEYLKPEIVNDLKIASNITLIPCIRNIIKKINPTHDERVTLVLYLSYSLRHGKILKKFNIDDLIDSIFEFMNNTCSHWMDYNPYMVKYYLNNIIRKLDIAVNCKYMMKKGLCIDCPLK